MSYSNTVRFKADYIKEKDIKDEVIYREMMKELVSKIPFEELSKMFVFKKEKETASKILKNEQFLIFKVKTK